MGSVYCGPFADVIGYHDHEGYAARIRPDGTETSTWTYATREFHGYRAHCACGWRGTAVHPATDAGEESALDDWDNDHLRPLIDREARRHTIRADLLLAFIHDLRQSVVITVDERGNEVFTEHSRGLLDAAERLDHVLDEQACRERHAR
jgi:hypothetical protein